MSDKKHNNVIFREIFKTLQQDKQTTSTHSADGIHLLISVWMLQNIHTHTHAHTSIFGICVRVNQEFLPSQSGPICWKLTCALTPLRVTLSEHRNTKSGKRKTPSYFRCFLMHLILKVLLSSSGCSISPPLNASNGLVFSAHVWVDTHMKLMEEKVTRSWIAWLVPLVSILAQHLCLQ